jgi:hypothetical protein
LAQGLARPVNQSRKLPYLIGKSVISLVTSGDAGLQLIALGTADAHRVALDRRLHLEFRILDQFDDLLRQLRLDADPDLQTPA